MMISRFTDLFIFVTRKYRSTICRASVLAALLAPLPGYAQAVSGNAEVMDGDSLVVGGTKVRLFGIDAPEYDQQCSKDGQDWPCGQEAKRQLEAMVSGQRLECRGVGKDTYGRILSVCSAGGFELNRSQVEQGWAVAYREFSDAYLGAELQAKANRLGIWGGSFVSPSEFRNAKLAPMPAIPRAARTASPRRSFASQSQGCVIKGNRNRKGQWIYHLPGMPYYDATRPEEIFCSEAQAQAAGYRRAMVRP